MHTTRLGCIRMTQQARRHCGSRNRLRHLPRPTTCAIAHMPSARQPCRWLRHCEHHRRFGTRRAIHIQRESHWIGPTVQCICGSGCWAYRSRYTRGYWACCGLVKPKPYGRLRSVWSQPGQAIGCNGPCGSSSSRKRRSLEKRWFISSSSCCSVALWANFSGAWSVSNRARSAFVQRLAELGNDGAERIFFGSLS